VLKDQLSQVLKQYGEVQALEERVASQSILEGYGRLDALNRIGNQVFSIDLKKPEKLRRLLRAGALSRGSGTRRGSTGCSITAPSCSRWCATPASRLACRPSSI
jgi:hypothetical protein